MMFGIGKASRRASFTDMGRMLFIAFSLVTAQACLPPGAQNSGLTQDKSTYVCIVLSTANWTTTSNPPVNEFHRLAFTPNADKFSRLVFSDTYSNSTSGGVSTLGYPVDIPLALHVESMGIVSYQKYYQVTTEGERRTFPVFTAIINVNRGVVTSITFDNGCVLCDNNARCISNTYGYNGAAYGGNGATSDCYVEEKDCEATPESCQLTVYVTWTGTDKNGNYLTSSTRRFSLFSSYSVNSYFNGLGKAIKNVKYNAYNQN